MDSDLKLVGGVHRMGGVTSMKIEVYMKLDRDISKEDERIVRDKIDEILDGIDFISAKNDPKKIRLQQETKEELLKCFGTTLVYSEVVPNEYCSRACCWHLPWLLVTTPKGKIKLGWRKRVINIEWPELNTHPNGEKLFISEDTTKGKDYIHAWDYDKAKEYITKLLEFEAQQ